MFSVIIGKQLQYTHFTLHSVLSDNLISEIVRLCMWFLKNSPLFSLTLSLWEHFIHLQIYIGSEFKTFAKSVGIKKKYLLSWPKKVPFKGNLEKLLSCQFFRCINIFTLVYKLLGISFYSWRFKSLFIWLCLKRRK